MTNNKAILVRALNGRGNALCSTAQRCAEAVPDFAAVVKMAPGIAGYWDNYARALRADKRFDEALAASDHAMALAPKAVFTYIGKAKTLAAEGAFDRALAVDDLAIGLAPRDAGLLEYRGKLLTDLRRYAEAYAAFDSALALSPTRMGVYVRRADAELAQGSIDAAITDLERYPSDGDEADEVRGKIAALRAVRDHAGGMAKEQQDATASSKTGPTRAPDEPVEPAPPAGNMAPPEPGSRPQEGAAVALGEQKAVLPPPDNIEAQHATGPGAAKGEVDACNAPDVLSTMTGALAKYQAAVRKAFGASKAGSEGATLPMIADRLTLNIRHIRQLSYDRTNNVRLCGGDFVYNFAIPFTLSLVSSQMPEAKPLCTGTVRWKIERTLDDPNQDYVTHYCQ